jgi:hypothetical protein
MLARLESLRVDGRPWAIASTGGSLSRRIRRLVERRAAPDQICRTSIAGMIFMAALLAGRVVWLAASVAVVEAEPKKPAEESKPPRVILPAGLVVEVIGIGHNPSKGQPWWAPDGTPIESPYERIDATTRSSDGEVSREVALRWIHKPQDVTVHSSPSTSSWYGGCRAFDANGKELPGIKVIAGAFLKTQKTFNLNFKIAAGPWENLTETPGRGYVTYSEKNHGYAISQAIEIGGATQITISHDVLDRDVRIVAVDHEGREIATEDRGGGDVKGFSQLTVIFYNLPLKDIKAFRLQARNWQKAEITGIALNPGEMTQPALKVEIPQGLPKT